MPRTTTGEVRAVARHAATVKDAFRRSRSLTTEKQTNPYVAQLAKDALTRDRSKCIEQVTALLVDLAVRGTLEDSEAIGQHLTAIARAEYASAHPEAAHAELSIAEAHQLEERAEGAADEAECAMAHHAGSMSHQLAYLAASAVHTRARRELDEAVRRTVAREAQKVGP
jgi:hypothetical protein